MPELVECLSSPSYPGEPVALTWDGERFAVDTILDRWRTPEAIGFRVRTTAGQVFELTYDLAADAWRVNALTPVPHSLLPPLGAAGGSPGESRQQEQQ